MAHPGTGVDRAGAGVEACIMGSHTADEGSDFSFIPGIAVLFTGNSFGAYVGNIQV